MTCRPGAGQASTESGERRLRGFCHPVQFEVELCAALAQPRDLGFEFPYATSEPGEPAACQGTDPSLWYRLTPSYDIRK